MTGPARRLTAEELMTQLRGDPAFRDREEQQRRAADEARAAYAAAAGPMLADLAAAGFPVSSAGELVKRFQDTGSRYTAAVPILVAWLPRVSYRPLQDDIVRTLSVPWARRDAAGPLIERFRTLPPHDGPPESDHRWLVGSALEVLAHPSIADDLLSLAADRRFGPARRMVVLALGRLKNDPRAVSTLLSALDDPDVAVPAIMALGKLKAPPARQPLERFLDHPDPRVRQEARKAIGKLGSS